MSLWLLLNFCLLSHLWQLFLEEINFFLEVVLHLGLVLRGLFNLYFFWIQNVFISLLDCFDLILQVTFFQIQFTIFFLNFVEFFWNWFLFVFQPNLSLFKWLKLLLSELILLLPLVPFSVKLSFYRFFLLLRDLMIVLDFLLGSLFVSLKLFECRLLFLFTGHVSL